MASFSKSIDIVFAHEGGYSNHPLDPGGETNHGITDRLDGKIDGLADVDGDGIGDVSMRKLSKEDARDIYKRVFWDKMQGDKIESQAIATILFDAYVNTGKWGVKLMQRVLGLKEDGVVGPKTLNAINSANESTLFTEYKLARIKYYNTLVSLDPAKKVFIKGWLKRIHSFQLP